MIKRGRANHIEPEVIYITPVHFCRRRPSKVVDRYTKWVGSPGTIDKNGLWIPNTIFRAIKKEVDPVLGKIKVPMRRSFYSGRRYPTSAGRHLADLLLKKQCNDERYLYSIARLSSGEYSPSKEIWAAIRKYQNHKYNIGARKKTSGDYVKRHTEGYMTIDGVVRIKKVLKEREIAPWTVAIPKTGVVTRGQECQL